MTDEPTGSCPTCTRRDPRNPILCDVCRSKLRSWLGDIPDLFEELERRTDELAEPLEHRPYVATVVEKVERPDGTKVKVVSYVLTKRAADQVAYVMPSGASSSPSRGGPVSGSRESRLPIDTDAVDLTAPARAGGRAVLAEDATGYTSVASTLDFWVEDWRTSRGAGERRPPPTVDYLTEWLLNRLDDAMDHSAPIDEFFHDVRRVRGALKAHLGQVEIPDYKRGIPCRRCLALTLVHHDGSDRIECASCPALLSFIEYDAHVRSLSAEHEQARRVKVAKVKALRGLLVALRSAGWQRAAEFEDAEYRPIPNRSERAHTVLIWWRGNERIEMRAAAGERTPHGLVVYMADVTSTRSTTSWLGDEPASYVQKVARAAGILTPVKQMEKAA